MDKQIERATELALEQMERFTRYKGEKKIEFFKQSFEAGISHQISKLLAYAHTNPEPKTD